MHSRISVICRTTFQFSHLLKERLQFNLYVQGICSLWKYMVRSQLDFCTIACTSYKFQWLRFTCESRYASLLEGRKILFLTSKTRRASEKPCTYVSCHIWHLWVLFLVSLLQRVKGPCYDPIHELSTVIGSGVYGQRLFIKQKSRIVTDWAAKKPQLWAYIDWTLRRQQLLIKNWINQKTFRVGVFAAQQFRWSDRVIRRC